MLLGNFRFAQTKKFSIEQNGDIHYSQTKLLGWRKMEFSSLFRLKIFFKLLGNFNSAQTEKFKIEKNGNFHFAHS